MSVQKLDIILNEMTDDCKYLPKNQIKDLQKISVGCCNEHMTETY
jgi:hypothetical protein